MIIQYIHPIYQLPMPQNSFIPYYTSTIHLSGVYAFPSRYIDIIFVFLGRRQSSTDSE